MTTHTIDHNGNSRLNALAHALMAALLLFVLYKLGVYFKTIPNGNFPNYVQSGWVTVGLSGSAVVLWIISAGQSKGNGPDDWALSSVIVALVAFVVSGIWMVVYQLFFTG